MLRGAAPGEKVFRAAAAAAAAAIDPLVDPDTDAQYRRELVGAMVYRALTEACAGEHQGSRIMTGPVDVTLTINGRRYPLRLEPRRTLLDAIRDECGLTGTHMGCEHGVCGACTVLVDGDPVRACLMFAVQAEGSARSVPSRGWPRATSLMMCSRPSSPITACNAASARRGSSCWRPASWSANPISARMSLLAVLSSNLCRCTGYQGIVAAVRAALAELREATK